MAKKIISLKKRKLTPTKKIKSNISVTKIDKKVSGKRRKSGWAPKATKIN